MYSENVKIQVLGIDLGIAGNYEIMDPDCNPKYFYRNVILSEDGKFYFNIKVDELPWLMINYATGEFSYLTITNGKEKEYSGIIDIFCPEESVRFFHKE